MDVVSPDAVCWFLSDSRIFAFQDVLSASIQRHDFCAEQASNVFLRYLMNCRYIGVFVGVWYRFSAPLAGVSFRTAAASIGGSVMVTAAVSVIPGVNGGGLVGQV